MSDLVSGFTEAGRLLWHGDAATYNAIFTTVKVSLSALIISLIIGLPLGFLLGFNKFRGKKVIKLVVNSCLSLPTVVIGLLIYLLLSSRGPLGSFNLLFTIYAIIIGETILALPIIIALLANVIEHVHPNLIENLRGLGMTNRQLAKTLLWEKRSAVLGIVLIAYGRVVSEIGIAMIVGGNIKWFTRTITTGIAFATGTGDFAAAIALGAVLMLLAITINLLASLLNTS